MITRRSLIGQVCPAVSALVVLGSPKANAAPKISKQRADYQDHPHDGLRCSTCCMFIPGRPNRCTMIEGIIDANGWCKYCKRGAADTCS